MIKKYRKKPVEIEALKFDGNKKSVQELCIWIDKEDKYGEIFIDYRYTPPVVSINTLEGKMIVGIGDYIIKGINGEFYPCKPDIFKKTYEEVEDEK